MNLTNCDKEPIQFLGQIQSYGFLIGISKKTKKINYASANIGELIPASADELLGKSPIFLNSFIQTTDGNNFINLYDSLLKNDDSDSGLSDITEIQISGKRYYLSHSAPGDTFLFEMEPVTADDSNTSIIFNIVSRIVATRSQNELYQRTTAELKQLTGYERVMVYRFLDDGTGLVVGESVDPHIDSFMGQYYPESDIPAQARALYKKNQMRITVDVNADTVNIVGDEKAPAPDLSYCSIRALSPTHILYLKNMGVASSYSISIMVDGELWGLIAFHACSAPKFIDLRIRHAAKLITGIFASQVATKATAYYKSFSDKFHNAILCLQNYLTINDSLTEALTGHTTNLLNVTNAPGVALIADNKLVTLGSTPDSNQIYALAEFVSQYTGDLYHTHTLLSVYSDAANFIKKGAGILVSRLSNDGQDMIIWFKPEKTYSVLWAGEPAKIVESKNDGDIETVHILPRTSFKVIKEIIKGTSDKWMPQEVDAAIKITQYIKDHILRQTRKQLEFNEKLKKAYDELDSFTYTVSHDLRAPLTVIRTYAQFLSHSQAINDEKGKTVLKNIISGTDKITVMLQKLLELSKISQQELSLEPINVAHVIENIIREQTLLYDISAINISIGDTPTIFGHELLLYHVFSNIISNAIKYSSRQAHPQISIQGYEKDGAIIYEIADNGLGMDETKHADAFKLFKRLDNAVDYEGSGAGLAIAKKVMDKHGGNITFTSKPEKGTIFYLTFMT